VTDTPVSPVRPAPARTGAPTAQVFVNDRDSEGVIRQSLSELGIHDAQIAQGTVKNAIASLAQSPSSRLLIVDLSGVDDPVARINELAEVCEPNTGVLAIGDRNDIILYRDLKYAGIVEYFFKPLVADLVTRVCNGILTGNVERRGPRTGRLVFVLGVRGGVGATTIATTTAWYLAETRQRWVMLVDLDLQNGDAALQLDVSPSHALREACEHPERVDQLFLERGAIHVSQRLELLASLDRLGDTIAVPEETVLSLLETLLHRYRFVFVDLPATLALGLTQVLHLPSTCVLVSNGSLAAARDVARWRARIGPNTGQRTMLHILNKHGGPGSLPDEEFNRAAGQAPDLMIPYDRAVEVASNLGIKSTQKNNSLKLGLAPLLRQLSGDELKVQQSLFSRIFG
jgi:pilus assembly protein CpaE